MTDSDLYDIHYEECVPEVPDVQAILNEKKETLKGKIAELDFRPVDFSMDLSKYLSFEMIFKLFGKPKGLGYDMCAITVDGDLDAAIGGSPFPDGAEQWTDGINSSIQDVQNQANANSAGLVVLNNKVDNIEIPETDGTFSLDSAINILYQQIDSVSDVVDSAGI